MISHRSASYNPMEFNDEGTIQAVMALLHSKQATNIPRWVCEECGMIHMGPHPLACDSCGHKKLTQQADSHWEMNTRW
ncbi:MAG TPA: hypothetical protein VFN35_18245 [Ktedonobacteraceae bacterium]|nr:hypothetical protein [Ktedonobacteraceae bacterium]